MVLDFIKKIGLEVVESTLKQAFTGLDLYTYVSVGIVENKYKNRNQMSGSCKKLVKLWIYFTLSLLYEYNMHSTLLGYVINFHFH